MVLERVGETGILGGGGTSALMLPVARTTRCELDGFA
jgi:hypothetical protein